MGVGNLLFMAPVFMLKSFHSKSHSDFHICLALCSYRMHGPGFPQDTLLLSYVANTEPDFSLSPQHIALNLTLYGCLINRDGEMEERGKGLRREKIGDSA